LIHLNFPPTSSVQSRSGCDKPAPYFSFSVPIEEIVEAGQSSTPNPSHTVAGQILKLLEVRKLRMRGRVAALLVFVLLLIVSVTIWFHLPQSRIKTVGNGTAPAAGPSGPENETSESPMNASQLIGGIRSVTFYVFPFDPDIYYSELKDAIPKLKRVGFNTIWIVNPWRSFNPKPLADPPLYDDSRFQHLREVLDLLKRNGMRAILGLNYLGKGWAPEGIEPAKWITDPEMYGAFEGYVNEFLTRIQDYHDIVYIVVFTEGTEPEGLDPYGDARKHAALLRSTLGSLPTRLDKGLRKKFLIGYHDYSLVNLDWARGESPIQLPIPYDFVSMVFYGWEDKDDEEIMAELDRRAGFFQALYPGVPLLLGELGASMCDLGEENQARVIGDKVSEALKRGYGFNIWHWRPIPDEDSCGNAAFRGLALTYENGTLKPAAKRVQRILQESRWP